MSDKPRCGEVGCFSRLVVQQEGAPSVEVTERASLKVSYVGDSFGVCPPGGEVWEVRAGAEHPDLVGEGPRREAGSRGIERPAMSHFTAPSCRLLLEAGSS